MYYGLGFSAIVIVFIIWINVIDSKRRSKLTEEERQQEDEQQEIEKRIW
jgi:hypothetical protein